MNRLRRQATISRQQHGFTLVEALVALVVLSIGMLGIAALYVESLRASRTALARSQAVTLASDMADRIRANRAGAASYAKAVSDLGAENANCRQGGNSSLCTPAIMANHDKAVWDAELKARLPGATGTIAVDAVAAPPAYTVTVNWVEIGQTISYTVRFQI